MTPSTHAVVDTVRTLFKTFFKHLCVYSCGGVRDTWRVCRSEDNALKSVPTRLHPGPGNPVQGVRHKDKSEHLYSTW